jgi:hypothetical protein
MRRITDNRQERPDGRDNPRRAARFGFCGLPPLMPARAVTPATEQIPCRLARMARTRVTDRHGRRRVYGTPNAGFERYPGQGARPVYRRH